MKTMKKFLSMAALALVGVTFTGCSSSDDNIIDQPQQPETKNNVVTLTTTVGLDDGGATTRALAADGVKTFAAGETMAIYYWKNKGNDHVKAVSAPLTAGDITNGGKSATFTFTLDNPYKDMSVSYVYPAAMANADFTPNYDALYNNQDGTLATLASNFDFCTRSGAWVGDNLPSLTLENQLAILAITLKNADGSSDITSSITGLTLSDGSYTYNVNRSAAAGPIYVAIRPTSDATITVTATDGTKNYTKTLTGKTYEAGNGYPVRWRMAAAIDYSTAQLGDLFYSDGTFSSTIEAGKTPIGVIAYLGTDAFSENGTTVNGSTFAGHGLVLCLKNAASNINWSTEKNTLEFGDGAKVTSVADLTRTTNVSGYTNTKTLAEKSDAATKYKAAYAAKNYTGLTAPAGTTGWFLPSAQQWVKMQTGIGALEESSITWNSWFDTNHTAADKWEAALSKAGSGKYDSMNSVFLWFWSSSEYSANDAVRLNVDATSTGGGYGFRWNYYSKDSSGEYNRVRPVLAF